jgi:hypothetical protein
MLLLSVIPYHYKQAVWGNRRTGGVVQSGKRVKGGKGERAFMHSHSHSHSREVAVAVTVFRENLRRVLQGITRGNGSCNV